MGCIVGQHVAFVAYKYLISQRFVSLSHLHNARCGGVLNGAKVADVIVCFHTQALSLLHLIIVHAITSLERVKKGYKGAAARRN